MKNVHFKSLKQDWKTPLEFFNGLNKEFNFTHDPCPSNSLLDSLLVQNWGEICFVNPPYDNIKEWLKKGYTESVKGKTIVFLIPSRTDTKWWHEYVMKATEIRFIKGRLKFDGAKQPAPFPSCVVVFMPTQHEAEKEKQ